VTTTSRRAPLLIAVAALAITTAGIAVAVSSASSSNVARAASATVQDPRTLEIPSFDSRIVVNRDGSIDVTETIEARFTGSWNGIYRQLPVEYRSPSGFNWSIRVSLRSATDDLGNELRTRTSRTGHYVKYKIWVPGAVNATRTVVLTYHAENALRFFDEHDELYWNATGDEWDVALGMVSATVVLPDGATGLRSTAFNGVQGATTQEAEIVEDGSSVRFRMPRPLAFREGMTVVVGWDKGLIAEPTATERVGGFLQSNWPLGLPLPVLAGMLLLWWRRGRDPRRRPIAVQYEPPAGLTPAEAGTLTDERVDMRDITATVGDLAVRGYLRIEEREEDRLFGLMKSEQYHFHRVRPRSDWTTLLPHERLVLDGIFADGADEVSLDDLKNEFYKQVSDIKTGVFEQLVKKGAYRARPDNMRAGWLVGGIFLTVLIALGGAALSGRFSLTPVPFVFAAIAIGLIVVIIGWNMPARTEPGTRSLESTLGFAEFLERVDRDRYQVKRTPEMFEAFLPYAMAFGVEEQWAKAFDGILTQPPGWYAGTHSTSFSASGFSRSLGAMTSSTASTMTSAPRSSSGSGFSGGSSGGGGGGGGGGGF
jgi:uncharacterized membrane protein